jgi:hypothetical protein
MKLTIESARNGFIISYKNEEGLLTKEVFSSDESETKALIELFYYVQEVLGVLGDRYSSERLFIGALPGDKYEGEQTELVKETLERIKYFLNEAEVVKDEKE